LLKRFCIRAYANPEDFAKVRDTTPKQFFASLCDLSFHTFVTPKIIQILYVISVGVVALASLAFLASGFQPSYSFAGSEGPNAGSILGHIVGALILFGLGVLAARIYLEIMIAVFRIAENTEFLRKQ
jgi:ABC-type phosphate transport system permease subunit